MKKITNIETNLTQCQDALKDRKSQFNEIKVYIKNNVNLINDSCKLSKNAHNELAKNNSAKVSKLYNKLSHDIEALTIKKESLRKVTKELECKDKILNIREKIMFK
jgi:hypothetical protein